MEIKKTQIPGLIIFQPRVFSDDRGYFMESYSKKEWESFGLNYTFVQDNESCSSRGVLRGLHFQSPPFGQDKIVRVIKGSVFDVAVDLRKGSPSYASWFGLELNEENKTQLFLPSGMAHAFLTLRDNTVFAYKVTAPYAPESDAGLPWNDADLNIQWPFEKYGIENPILSEKDSKHRCFKDFVSPFIF